MRMHGGLLSMAFCMYVCMSGCDWTKSQTGPKVTDIGKYHVDESW